MYKIVRHYENAGIRRRVIATGLTHERRLFLDLRTAVPAYIAECLETAIVLPYDQNRYTATVDSDERPGVAQLGTMGDDRRHRPDKVHLAAKARLIEEHISGDVGLRHGIVSRSRVDEPDQLVARSRGRRYRAAATAATGEE